MKQILTLFTLVAVLISCKEDNPEPVYVPYRDTYFSFHANFYPGVTQWSASGFGNDIFGPEQASPASLYEYEISLYLNQERVTLESGAALPVDGKSLNIGLNITTKDLVVGQTYVTFGSKGQNVGSIQIVGNPAVTYGGVQASDYAKVTITKIVPPELVSKDYQMMYYEGTFEMKLSAPPGTNQFGSEIIIENGKFFVGKGIDL